MNRRRWLKGVPEKLDLAVPCWWVRGLRFGPVDEEPDKGFCEDDAWAEGEGRSIMHSQWKRLSRQGDQIQS